VRAAPRNAIRSDRPECTCSSSNSELMRKATQDEEDVDADEPAGDSGQACVRCQHSKDGEGLVRRPVQAVEEWRPSTQNALKGWIVRAVRAQSTPNEYLRQVWSIAMFPSAR